MDIREQAAAVTLPAVTLVNIDKLMKTTNSIIGQMQNELMPLVNELGGGGDKEVSKLLENAAGCLLALASSVSGQALVGSYIKE
ncbi:hypothetical protein ACW5WQ_20190 [Aeromonas rivuli]|uniref:hypothetical protein n=1 Tax=Aeromonas TaxID=642 RepID=UPI0005A9D560|nr:MULTISPECIES: hypothetical protein [Aeromonas]AUV10762.1 hypothetical protein C2U39_00300 [Aeromonas sp. ASNIH3]